MFVHPGNEKIGYCNLSTLDSYIAVREFWWLRHAILLEYIEPMCIEAHLEAHV
jgi:hypothetical protein